MGPRGGDRQGEDTSPRDPERGALHRILREHLATFLSEREEAGAPLAKFVVDELRGYLDCGVLSRGCAHFKCDDCGADRVTGLSCKGRGFCPRCCGRRMTQGARDLVEEVFPHERVRQWVLSFPFALRWPLAFRHELMLAVSRIAAEEIERRSRASRSPWLRRRRLHPPAGGEQPPIRLPRARFTQNVGAQLARWPATPWRSPPPAASRAPPWPRVSSGRMPVSPPCPADVARRRLEVAGLGAAYARVAFVRGAAGAGAR